MAPYWLVAEDVCAANITCGFSPRNRYCLGNRRPRSFGAVQVAPRYDPRILLAVRTLDDRTQPMAEIARRVGAAAAELGLPKPSYVHLRRLIIAYREEEDAEQRRREEIKQIAAEVYFDLYRGKRVDAYEVADRINEAGR
jgi:hypothetical protein